MCQTPLYRSMRGTIYCIHSHPRATGRFQDRFGLIIYFPAYHSKGYDLPLYRSVQKDDSRTDFHSSNTGCGTCKTGALQRRARQETMAGCGASLPRQFVS